MEKVQSWLTYSLFSIGNFHFQATYILKLALIILSVRLILWTISKYFNRQIKSNKIEKGSAYAFRQIFAYILWLAAIIVFLQVIGLNISLLLAGSAALLVGIGLGIQQTFNDFFSGIILLMEGSIKVDDVVEFDDMVCRVKRIGVRSSMVVNRDEISVIVPNSKFTSETVINWTYSEHAARFNVDVGVAYGSDVGLVASLLKEAAIENPKVIKESEPFVRLKDFNESSIDFGVYFWTLNVFSVEQTKSDIRFRILEKFREKGITIPFPQRDLHVFKMENVKSSSINKDL